MYSVTSRIKSIKQPRGGYIKPSAFEQVNMEDQGSLNPVENVPPTTMGMVVDYLTRFATGAPVREAFEISLKGAAIKSEYWDKNANTDADEYLDGIKGLDDKSIINACKMVAFDVWYRNPNSIIFGGATDPDGIEPDQDTIDNIRTMVNRSVSFFEKYGPVTVDGFTFEPDGYTKTVSAGDGDFLTEDTLWDFKVSKNKPTTQHTLQLLMYWIMGQHSGKPEYKNITKIGIFNPRLNVVYLLDMGNVPKETITEVEDDVICY